MSIPSDLVAKILQRVKLRYPDWDGFNTPSFVKDELEYKWKAAEKARQALSQEEFQRLLQVDAVEEILQRLERVGRETNLLYLRTPKSSDLRLLYEPSLDQRAFVAQVYDLLYGPSDSPERLQRFVDFLGANGLTPYWTFPTYFLFLVHPETDVFVKPRMMKAFFGLVGRSDEWVPRPSGEAYRSVVSLAEEIREAFAPHHPRDMIDIQSLMWVAANTSQKQAKSLADPFSHIFVSWEEAEAGFHSLGAALELLGIRDPGDARVVISFPKDHQGRVLRLIFGNWLVVDLRGPEAYDGHGITLALRDDLMAASLWADAFPRSTTFETKEKELEFSLYHLPWLLLEEMDAGLRAICEQSMRDIGQRFAHWKASNFHQYHHPEVMEAIFDAEKRRALLARGLSPKLLPEALEKETITEKVHTEVAFSPRAFELLAGLHENPTKAYFQEHRDAFETEVIGPFKRLLSTVAQKLPASITDIMETEKGVFSRILKNDYGRGGAWDFFWGAFYPRGSKRTADAQLGVWMNYQCLEYGFYIGEYGEERRARFVRNCRNHPEFLNILLDHMPDRDRFVFGQHKEHFEITDTGEIKILDRGDWKTFLQDPATFIFSVSILWSRKKVLSISFDELVEDISRIYQELFPLVLMALEDDPMPAIARYLDEEVAESNPIYPLEQMVEETGFALALLERWVRAIHRKGQAIFYGPPGTGKTFAAEHLARHLVGGGDGLVELVQFHPAYAYEDFIQGIRPESDGERLTYPMKPGRFLEFIAKARQRQGVSVLIIDEINRANLARVFGELMYLLEYRDCSIPLAGGGELRIPDNVRILGTMNTADRSIALVDHALRRRFAFFALWPDYDLLRRYHRRHGTEFPVERLIQVLKELNRTIGDRHYKVGVSFFMSEDLVVQIGDIWQMEIEPYLEEYFFDQPEKVNSFQWNTVRHQVLMA